VQDGDLASAKADCGPVENPFGEAPAGWSYEAADLAQRERLIKTLQWTQLEQYGLDLSFAYRGDEQEPRGILAALSSIDRSELHEFLDGVEEEAHGARTKVVHREIADADTRVVDPPDGSRAIFGTTKCRAMIVLGVQKQSAELLAPSVFKN
jgi:hypothetical protein